MGKKKAQAEAPTKATKAQFPTTPDDEARLKTFLDREKATRRLTLSRRQAFALLFRRGLDVEEQEARAT